MVGQGPLPAAQARPPRRRKRRGNAGGDARGRGGTRSTQATDYQPHRGQSVLHRGDGAGAVRRGRVGTQWRSEGCSLALATASAVDGAGYTGLPYRPAFGGAEGTAPDPRGDRPGVAAWPNQGSGLQSGGTTGADAYGFAGGRVHLRAASAH